MPDGTISYPKFMDEIVSDEKRNDTIIEDICEASGTCLILTDRVRHVDILKSKLEEKGVSCLSLSAASTKKAKAEREVAIHSLREKRVKALVATYALAKEGLDIPNLNNLFMATPQKNETVVTQSAGRVARKAEGKEFGTIYDYLDDFSMLKSWQKKRASIYKKLGFNIE